MGNFYEDDHDWFLCVRKNINWYFSFKFRLQYLFIKEGCLFIGPYPHMDYHIGSKLCKFYFIRINFTLSQLVFFGGNV
jgi:hypothetical protein